MDITSLSTLGGLLVWLIIPNLTFILPLTQVMCLFLFLQERPPRDNHNGITLDSLSVFLHTAKDSNPELWGWNSKWYHFTNDVFCSQERNRTSLQGATRHPWPSIGLEPTLYPTWPLKTPGLTFSSLSVRVILQWLRSEGFNLYISKQNLPTFLFCLYWMWIGL